LQYLNATKLKKHPVIGAIHFQLIFKFKSENQRDMFSGNLEENFTLSKSQCPSNRIATKLIKNT